MATHVLTPEQRAAQVVAVTKWKNANREKVRANDKARRLANLDRFRQRERDKDQRRRAQRGSKPLPVGTVQNIGKIQRWRCGACRTSIRQKYHIDHIMPLAKKGKHEPRNIQLLCPSCNQRKSAKDPIDFMREEGRLL